MKYIRKRNGTIEEHPASPYMGATWYEDHGYLFYSGPLSLSRLDVVAGEVVELPEPPPEVPSVFTKIQVRTACRALGIEQKLDNLLSSSRDFSTFWAESLEVDMNYEMTQAAMKTGTFSEAEIASIIKEMCK